MTEQKDPLVGTRIREYEILDILGRGGMGAVYKARHIYLDEERAIKVVRTGRSNFVDRFIREARILTKLRHPNLVQLYEFGTLEEETFFMVLEFLHGESVLQRIKRTGRIPVKESLKIIREAALGLQVAHQIGIVHRDISPDNLFLVKNEAGNETTKVIDFGIAKPTLVETNRYTLGDMFIGKLEYSSPEQCGFHEEGETIDHRSDIYSLAITLYYMIAGKLPFSAATPQGYMVKHASEPPAPLSSHFEAGALPKTLDDLILKALSKKRSERQPNVAALIQDIEAILFHDERPTTNPTQPAVAIGADFPVDYVFANRYIIQAKIGTGGMGTVYKATDRMLDVPVALKTLKPGIADTQKSLDRFKREVILARRVAHRNVCRIYDIGESEGVHYVSMEYIEGTTLSDLLESKGSLSIQEGLQVVVQILDALREAHHAGIVHRDLKPQNIIVDSHKRACITDFGISTSATVSRLTESGTLVGTPRYMAPEQFRNQNVDQRSDIYSISMIMYEIFTGRLPFEAETPAEVMYHHLEVTPPPLSEFNPTTPREIERVVLKGLAKDPAGRFQTVDEMLEALSGLITTYVDASSISGAHRIQLQRTTPVSAQQPQSSKVEKENPLKSMQQLVRKNFASPNLRYASIAAVVVFIGLLVWILSSGKKVSPVAQSTPATSEAKPVELKPAPMAAVTSRNVKIESSPQGAALFLDGKALGSTTPAQITLASAEPRELRLELNGYQAVTQNLTKDSPQTLTFQLVPVSVDGHIRYNGPHPVMIYYTGELILDTTSGDSALLPAGEYEITIIGGKKAVIREVRKVTVEPGKMTIIEPPPLGVISVTANPSNAKILIGSHFEEFAPIFDLPIQVGKHHVVVKWEKLNKQQSIDLDIAPGVRKTLNALIENDQPQLIEVPAQ